MKHLLLEGRICEGKSTAILQSLAGSLRAAAGYGTVRTFEIGGGGQKISRGYCQLPAGEMTGVEARYIPNHPGNFLVFEGDRIVSDSGVFYRYSLPLAERREASFILLDELGGFELLEEEIRRRLLGILQGEIPCIGVLKSPENMKRTKDRLELLAGFDRSYGAFRRQLEAMPSLRIHRFEREKREEAIALIESWKQENGIGLPEVLAGREG